MSSAFIHIGFTILTLLVALTIANAFPQGKERSYNFVSDVNLSDFKNGPSIGYQVTGVVRVGSIWSSDNYSLLKFKLVNPKLKIISEKSTPDISYRDHRSSIDTSRNDEFFALWHEGQISKVFISNKEDQSMINLKKSAISLFQYQLLDGTYVENDVSGKCDVVYESQSPEIYKKKKISCQSDDFIGHSRSDNALGISTISSRTADFKVTPDGILDKIESREIYRVFVRANKNAGHKIETRIFLKFDGNLNELSTIASKTVVEAIATLRNVEEKSLKTTFNDQCANNKCPTLKTVVKDVKNDLTFDKMGTSAAALALVKAIASARKTSKEDFLKILNARTMQELKGQLLDILAATQTIESHQAAMSVLKLTSEDDILNAERYLQSLSVGSRPQKSVILNLLELMDTDVKSSKVKDTLIQTLASMAYRYTKLQNNGFNSAIVQKVTSSFKGSLDKCKDATCTEMYIRSMHNLKSPANVDILLKYAYDKDRKISVAAMKALQSYSTYIWDEKRKKKLEDVFHQKTKMFDSSSRTLSLDIILTLQPDKSDVERLLYFLQSNDKAFEVKRYLLQKIIQISEKCPTFRKKVQVVLETNPTLNNYDIFGQQGLSTVLSRQYSSYPSFNATLLSIQEIYNGVLKRGVVDMQVKSKHDKFSAFTLGLYTAGLSSFVGGSENSDDSEESATAGMEITLQESLFRPLEFFNGHGELMGHVWSGTASEPTTAYVGTTLLQDHEESLRLQNGALMSINVQGAVSIDLNGQVQFSLWNRNAHCQVDKSAGIAVLGTLLYDAGFATLQSEFIVTQEPKLKLVSDIDFSSDVMLCLQLSQPATVLSHNIVKTEKITGTRRRKITSFKKRFHIPGYTHALNQKNNEMCSVIFGI